MDAEGAGKVERGSEKFSALLKQKGNYAQLAHIVGCSKPAISQMMAASPGIFPADGTMLDWVRAYIDRIRKVASGRSLGLQTNKMASGESVAPDMDPMEVAAGNITEERAKLIRTQRERETFKLNVLREEYAPISLLSETLALASAAVAGAIDQTANRLSVECDGLSAEVVESVQRVLADARNKWSEATAELIKPDDIEDDADGDAS